MATATLTELVTKTITASGTPSSTYKATPQGGILEGGNPSHYDSKNPIILFIIQAAIVLVFTRLLHFPLSKIGQPRVIAEVITGIILGPSIMGRIPGFTEAIFPTASMPAFSLVANLGLVFFLFLVGLEIDLRFMVSNWRVALSVGAAGMALPFGLGCAIAWGLYHQFREPGEEIPISFGVYMLFIGVAMAITAFPVLCRILTSLKLLRTPVGVIVLAAGVANDVVGWILLALCVALVNSSAGLTALYIFLVAIGYVVFLVYLVRPAFMWILRRTDSLANGPTQSVVALTVLMVLASAFFTGVIGIHPIFGAFMIGLLAPHDGGFAIKLTGKLEDFISVLFLPLYFALSGLSTNLGLLDNGVTWGYVVGVTVCAFAGKIIGGTLASRQNGLVWRESLAIGCLMSCKGLVELIVLNIGLQAKILTTRTFTIFVVMALVTTFATTPLTKWLYPPSYQQKLDLWKRRKIDWDGNPIISDDDHGEDMDHMNSKDSQDVAKRIVLFLRLDGLPSLFHFMALFSSTKSQDDKMVQQQQEPQPNTSPLADPRTPQNQGLFQLSSRPSSSLSLHALRLHQLTERDSSVMQVTELSSYALRDPVLKAFSAFARSQDVAAGGSLAVVPENSFAETLTHQAADMSADLLLIPWSDTGTMSESPPTMWESDIGFGSNPLANRAFASFVKDVFDSSSRIGAATAANVGVWIDRAIIRSASMGNSYDGLPQSPNALERSKSRHQLVRTQTGLILHSQYNNEDEFPLSALSPASGRRYYLLVPYFGTNDDELAVRLAAQLSASSNVRVVVLDLRSISSLSMERQRTKSLDRDSEYTNGVEDENNDHSWSTLKAHLTAIGQERVTFETATMDTEQNDTRAPSKPPGSLAIAVGKIVQALTTNAPASTEEPIFLLGRNSHGLMHFPSQVRAPSHSRPRNTSLALDPTSRSGQSPPPASQQQQPSSSTPKSPNPGASSSSNDSTHTTLGPIASELLALMTGSPSVPLPAAGMFVVQSFARPRNKDASGMEGIAKSRTAPEESASAKGARRRIV